MAFTKTEHCSTPVVEHSLSHMNCFKEYLTMFEETLQEFVKSEGSDNAEFYQQLMECQKSPNITPEETLFIQCLLASADYDSFYSVMVKEAKKLIILQEAGKVRDDNDDNNDNNGDEEGNGRAESKGGDEEDEEDEEGGAKGGGGEEK